MQFRLQLALGLIVLREGMNEGTSIWLFEDIRQQLNSFQRVVKLSGAPQHASQGFVPTVSALQLSPFALTTT
jgi:hypothetical protein